jgi:predicted HAD superfamily Cof-like phosphohydrolase
VLDGLGNLDLVGLDHVNIFAIVSEIFLGQIYYPGRDSGRK